MGKTSDVKVPPQASNSFCLCAVTIKRLGSGKSPRLGEREPLESKKLTGEIRLLPTFASVCQRTPADSAPQRGGDHLWLVDTAGIGAGEAERKRLGLKW